MRRSGWTLSLIHIFTSSRSSRQRTGSYGRPAGFVGAPSVTKMNVSASSIAKAMSMALSAFVKPSARWAFTNSIAPRLPFSSATWSVFCHCRASVEKVTMLKRTLGLNIVMAFWTWRFSRSMRLNHTGRLSSLGQGGPWPRAPGHWAKPQLFGL